MHGSALTAAPLSIAPFPTIAGRAWPPATHRRPSRRSLRPPRHADPLARASGRERWSQAHSASRFGCIKPLSHAGTLTVQNYSQPHSQRQNASNPRRRMCRPPAQLSFVTDREFTFASPLTPAKTLCYSLARQQCLSPHKNADTAGRCLLLRDPWDMPCSGDPGEPRCVSLQGSLGLKFTPGLMCDAELFAGR